jgi:hypothetical protein
MPNRKGTGPIDLLKTDLIPLEGKKPVLKQGTIGRPINTIGLPN